ncbi:MAG: hypothetical protein AAF709_13240, partial [Pseudomonadota bacterium]
CHHIEMAAVQPFVSGAISKTVNLPTSATAADCLTAYQAAHAKGRPVKQDQRQAEQPSCHWQAPETAA